MHEQHDSQQGVTVPDARYFEKATDLIASYDKLLASLYSTLIAGVILLLLTKEVSPWVGAFLLLALVFFVFGIGHTLLHMNLHVKVLLALENWLRGVEHLPSVIGDDEPTPEVYVRILRRSQSAFLGELCYLLLGVVAGGVAVVVHVWQYTWRAALVVALATALLLAVGVAVNVWRKPQKNGN